MLSAFVGRRLSQRIGGGAPFSTCVIASQYKASGMGTCEFGHELRQVLPTATLQIQNLLHRLSQIFALGRSLMVIRTLPAYHGLWPHDRHGLEHRRKPAIQLDEEQAIAVVNWARPRTWRCSTISCCLNAAFSAASRLLGLKIEAPRFKRKNISAAIAANVKRFCQQIKTDEVFGTHRRRRAHRVAGFSRCERLSGIRTRAIGWRRRRRVHPWQIFLCAPREREVRRLARNFVRRGTVKIFDPNSQAVF
jgi:hypothetical protein